MQTDVKRIFSLIYQENSFLRLFEKGSTIVLMIPYHDFNGICDRHTHTYLQFPNKSLTFVANRNKLSLTDKIIRSPTHPTDCLVSKDNFVCYLTLTQKKKMIKKGEKLFQYHLKSVQIIKESESNF